MDSSVEYPKVETMRGPKPVTAPFAVYLIRGQSTGFGSSEPTLADLPGSHHDENKPNGGIK